MSFHFVGNCPAQHPSLAHDICPLIDQELRAIGQGAVIHSIRVERLGIPQSRFTKCTLVSVQKAYTQIFRSSGDHKMGAILSAVKEAGLEEGKDYQIDYQNASFDDNMAIQIAQASL